MWEVFLFLGAVGLGAGWDYHVGFLKFAVTLLYVSYTFFLPKRLQWCFLSAKLVTGWCSFRQAIILTREALSHFQESEPFSHTDPEESEETRFLNLLGTIFKGNSLSSVNKQNISTSVHGPFTICQTWAYLTEPGAKRGPRGVGSASAL